MSIPFFAYNVATVSAVADAIIGKVGTPTSLTALAIRAMIPQVTTETLNEAETVGVCNLCFDAVERMARG